jgi:hypothetical protein
MTRGWVLLAAALALAWTAEAGAEPRGQKAQKTQATQKAPAARELPLHIYLAKGEASACGEGCSEWIAVEGRFESDSAGRVIAFLQRHGGRKLPLYFSSPGGDGRSAMAIGRFLRQRGLTAGVAKTVPRGCESDRDLSSTCRAAKRSSQPVVAEWRPDGFCNSACVYALIGARVREITPAARLGVHTVRLTMFRKRADGRVETVPVNQAPSLHQSRVADFNAQLRRYIVEMGINAMLFDTAVKVPHEDIYHLSRDQIAAFGIDQREYAETPWFTVLYPNNTTYLNKWIVEARGSERKDYRVSVVALACGQQQRVRVQYVRGLARGELSGPVSVIILIGDRKISLTMSGYPTKRDPIDVGATFASTSGTLPLVALEPLAAAAAAEIVEIQSRRQESAACHQADDRGAGRGHQGAGGEMCAVGPAGQLGRRLKSPARPCPKGELYNACRALRRLPRAGAWPGCRRTKEEVTAHCLHGGGAQ